MSVQHSVASLLILLGAPARDIPSHVNEIERLATFDLMLTSLYSENWEPRESWENIQSTILSIDFTHAQYLCVLMSIFCIGNQPITRDVASILLSKLDFNKFRVLTVLDLVMNNHYLRSDVMDLFLDKIQENEQKSMSFLQSIYSKVSPDLTKVHILLFQAIQHNCIGAVQSIVKRYPATLNMKNKIGLKPLHAVFSHKFQPELSTPILAFLLEQDELNGYRNVFSSTKNESLHSLSTPLDLAIHFLHSEYKKYSQKTDIDEFIKFRNNEEREAYKRARNAKVGEWKCLDLCVQTAVRQNPSFSILLHYYSTRERASLHSIYFQIELLRYFSSELTRSFDGKSFLHYMLEAEPDMNPILLKHIANGYYNAMTRRHPKTGLYPFLQPAIERSDDEKRSIDCLTNIYEMIRMDPSVITLHMQKERICDEDIGGDEVGKTLLYQHRIYLNAVIVALISVVTWYVAMKLGIVT